MRLRKRRMTCSTQVPHARCGSWHDALHIARSACVRVRRRRRVAQLLPKGARAKDEDHFLALASPSLLARCSARVPWRRWTCRVSLRSVIRQTRS
jgi:hypothetical protein